MTTTLPQNAYLVANGTGTLYPTVVLARDPTLNDLNGPNGQKFQVTQRWVNSVTDKEWFLLNFITTQGYYQAHWVQIAGGSATTETLTGNSGGAVPPTGNNINVVGDGTSVNVVGNPGTSTLTISAVTGSTIVETLTGNTGGAVSPTAGNINVKGDGTTISVSGNPGTSTLTISAVGSGILESLTGDSGTAAPSAGTINVYGNTSPAATGLTFTGSGSTLSLGGDLNVAHGGTGDTSFTPYTVICGGTTNTGPLQNVASVGTAAQILTSNGAGALPTFQSVFAASGTFIPTLTFGGASVGITYGFQGGEYWQIGSVVFYNVQVLLTNKGSSTGQAAVVLTGLPNSVNRIGTPAGSFFANLTLDAGYTQVVLSNQPNTNTLAVQELGSGELAITMNNTYFTNTSEVSASGLYFTT